MPGQLYSLFLRATGVVPTVRDGMEGGVQEGTKQEIDTVARDASLVVLDPRCIFFS